MDLCRAPMPDHRCHSSDGADQQPRKVPKVEEQVPNCGPLKLTTRRQLVGVPWLAGGPVDRRRTVHDVRQQSCGRDAVGQRVVHLADDHNATAFETFDGVRLPQWSRAVERAAGYLADDVFDLLPCAW